MLDGPLTEFGPMGRPTPKQQPRDTDAARRVDMLTQYDQLGQLSRAAISDSPIDMHIGRMLDAAPIDLIGEYGWDDAKLAEWITRQIATKTKMKPADFMLVPRRVMNPSGRRGATLPG